MKLSGKGLDAIVKRRKRGVPIALMSLRLKGLFRVGEFNGFWAGFCETIDVSKLIVLGGGSYAQMVWRGLICRLYRKHELIARLHGEIF